MQWTNRFNIPSPIVKAVQRDTYNPGNSDVSVTRLILPPKLPVKSDVRDWRASAGSTVYSVQKAQNTGCETEMEMLVNGEEVADD